MKNSFIFIIALLCTTTVVSQELLVEDGLYYEKPIVYDTSQNRYSLDNIFYKINRVFIYDYYYVDRSGEKKKFLLKRNYADENPMNLTDHKNLTDSTIDKIRIRVNNPLNIWANGDSSFTQTVFVYDYLLKNGKPKDPFAWIEGLSGVIDNKKNLWIHPPRHFSFKILEFNPYPFYYLDESVKSWKTKLEIGGFWLDPRWINHKEIITVNYEYTRAKDETLLTPMGNIICKVTNAVANSEYGRSFMKTYLKSYYNPKYGFVKLEYINING